MRDSVCVCACACACACVTETVPVPECAHLCVHACMCELRLETEIKVFGENLVIFVHTFKIVFTDQKYESPNF